MIPLPAEGLPKAETNTETVIETLNGDDWVPLRSLSPEEYSMDQVNQPGVLKFTATVTNEVPVYFNYGWCTTSEEVLQQNLEHIKVALFINDKQLTGDSIHVLSYSLSNGLVCSDVGTLLSEWQAGTYQLKTVATFNEAINDGMDDYKAGDYISEYIITVTQ
jgi:hypothetical protein